MQINETTYNAMPAHLRALFVKLPNPGREEVVGCFPADRPGCRRGVGKGSEAVNALGDGLNSPTSVPMYNDSGSAARFFYCAKASKRDREEGLEGFELKESGVKNDSGRGFSESDPNKKIMRSNHHPTVKPTDLMRYLCRLVTPPNGVVLDPFMGSGSTGKAAVLEGFSFVGMELDSDYFKIAQARVSSGNQSDSGQCGLFDEVIAP